MSLMGVSFGDIDRGGVLLVTLAAIHARLRRGAERIASGRWWTLRATLAVAAVSLFLSFPDYGSLGPHLKEPAATWKAVLLKSEAPAYNLLEAFGPNSNASRVNFRLTMPLLARYLRLGVAGLVAANFLAGLVLLWLVVLVAFQITGSRVASVFVALGVGSTWAGITGFSELRGMFDAVGLVSILVMLYTRRFAVSCAAMFLGAWTDERVLVAGPLVLVSQIVLLSKAEFDKRTLVAPAVLGTLAGVVLHCGSRFLYMASFGIPHRFDGNGLPVLLNQVNMIPMGAWTAYEGNWLVVLAAFLVLIRIRKWLLLAGLGGALAAVLMVSLAAVDISRTTAFALPGLFCALGIVSWREEPGVVEALCLCGCLACVLWPAYYVGGKSSIWWGYPFPVHMVRMLAGRT